jgi:hypothetical protein
MSGVRLVGLRLRERPARVNYEICPFVFCVFVCGHERDARASGGMVFIHVRAVRFRYGLQLINNYLKKPRNLFFEAFFIGFGCSFFFDLLIIVGAKSEALVQLL